MSEDLWRILSKSYGKVGDSYKVSLTSWNWNPQTISVFWEIWEVSSSCRWSQAETASSSDTKTVDVQWHCQWRRRKMKNSSPSNSFFDFLVVKTRVTNPSYDKPLSMAAAGNMYKYQKRWVCPSATCSCTIICALSSFWNPKGCEFESKRTKVLNLDLPWCESIFDPGHMKSMGKG